MSEVKIRELKNDNTCDPFDPLYLKFLNFRNAVLRIPIGMSLFDEDLSQEINCPTLIAVVKDPQDQVEKVIGCVMLQPYGNNCSTYRLRQMAVDPNHQASGLGSKLIYAAENVAKDQGRSRIYLHARKTAVMFYQKQGYQLICDKEFLESGIPHFEMEKTIQ